MIKKFSRLGVVNKDKIVTVQEKTLSLIGNRTKIFFEMNP